MLQGIKALNLAEQNERTQVVLTQHEFLELGELFKFHQVCVVDDQVKPHIDKVDLLNKVVEFSPRQHFHSVAVDVQHTVAFDLGVTRLDERFLTQAWNFLILLLVKSLDFFCPFLLDYPDHITVVFGLVLRIGKMRFHRLDSVSASVGRRFTR